MDKWNKENELDIENDVFHEETAAELIDDELIVNDEVQATKNVYGWIAIALSIISFVISPYIFAGAAIILGMISRGRDGVILGNIAIVIGVISIISRIVLIML